MINSHKFPHEQSILACISERFAWLQPTHVDTYLLSWPPRVGRSSSGWEEGQLEDHRARHCPSGGEEERRLFWEKFNPFFESITKQWKGAQPIRKLFRWWSTLPDPMVFRYLTLVGFVGAFRPPESSPPHTRITVVGLEAFIWLLLAHAVGHIPRIQLRDWTLMSQYVALLTAQTCAGGKFCLISPHFFARLIADVQFPAHDTLQVPTESSTLIEIAW
jgi:hypothetical protein